MRSLAVVFCGPISLPGTINIPPDRQQELGEVTLGGHPRYWMGFNLVKGIGPVRLRALLSYFDNLEVAWQASPTALMEAGLQPKLVQRLVQVRERVDLDQEWALLRRKGIGVLTWQDRGYPRYLREIPQPPPVLYVRGDLQPEDEWAVAVVGTRRMTAYGRSVTRELVSALARNGVTVVSGLARGIDSIAHEGALRSGGRTIAVLGSGVDQIYPPENRRLAKEIIMQGAVISDYPPGTLPEATNFPPRNRIISGLSRAVVVVEAGARSGALITAGFAADQGREVFAVPGNITAPQSQGANLLIQQGARPLLSSRDVLETLDLEYVVEQRAARIALPADELEAQLLALMSLEPVHIDELRQRTNMSINQVSATLALMELKGMVRQVGGMNYILLREQTIDYQVDSE